MSLEWRKRWFFIALPMLIASIFFIADFKTDISAFFIAGESTEEILLANEMQSGESLFLRKLVLGIPAQAS